MILSDRDIVRAINSKEIEITGWENEIHIGSSSIDLHLDSRAMVLDESKFEPGEEMDFSRKEKSAEKFSRHDGWEVIAIEPSIFYILSTVEVIKFADDIVGFVQGRSSVARMGIQVHCAGFADAGFHGNITLEVTNLTNKTIRIPKHTRICQMVFARMQSKAAVPYGKRPESKYQGQVGPTLTSIFKDYEQKN